MDELSIATDYLESTGDTSGYLKQIAEAGFSHIHWCHQWNTDFLYSASEIKAIAQDLSDYGLILLDLHGSAGSEKQWGSSIEYKRLAGVELVQNRIEMTAELGSSVVIMHLPTEVEWDSMRKSLDSLEPLCRKQGVRLAIENGNFTNIRKVFSEYDPSFIGLCYDCGHGNVAGDGLDRLEETMERLLSIHLHDNDGTGDQHSILFSGTVVWEQLAGIIAGSSYSGCVSMELNMKKSGFEDETLFLKEAFRTGTEFSLMIEKAKG
ncbi:sugar phosphate isomerase/epimerase family protein [Planctomycetota bacterium]